MSLTHTPDRSGSQAAMAAGAALPPEIAIVGMASHDSSLCFIVPDSPVGAAGNTVVHETPSRTCIARP